MDVYLLDFSGQVPGNLELISRMGGAPSDLGASWATVSNLGHVVFQSSSTNLVGNDTNGTQDIFGSQAFALFVDGFESGDTMAWSATTP